ncbi:MAG: DUF805 domain-containing protein [Hyphomonadaceae bacterium]|nr:DUF805 domain-containing protein [Hyphomonadaceae bacterium]
MDKLNAWVSSEGRLSRKGYLQLFVAPFAALILFTWLAWVAAPDLFGGMPAALFTLPWLAFLATADAQNIKRWHDLGVSGALYKFARPFVVLLPVGAMVLQFILPSFMAMSGDYGALAFLISQDLGGWHFGPAPMAMFAVTIVGVIGNIAWLSAMPGQSGPNSFGPDPMSGVQLPGISAAAPADANNDPVKRALADYQARLAQQARPAAMVTQVRPAPGGAFGRKRA